jgi:hypothetical protein
MDSLSTFLAIIASCAGIVGTILGIRLTLLQLRSHSLSTPPQPPLSSPPLQSPAAQKAPSHQFTLQELESILKESKSRSLARNTVVLVSWFALWLGLGAWLLQIYGSWTSLGLHMNTWPSAIFYFIPFFGPVLFWGWIDHKMSRAFVQGKTYGKFKDESELEKEMKLLKQQHVP